MSGKCFLGRYIIAVGEGPPVCMLGVSRLSSIVSESNETSTGALENQMRKRIRQHFTSKDVQKGQSVPP